LQRNPCGGGVQEGLKKRLRFARLQGGAIRSLREKTFKKKDWKLRKKLGSHKRVRRKANRHKIKKVGRENEQKRSKRKKRYLGKGERKGEAATSTKGKLGWKRLVTRYERTVGDERGAVS